MQPEQHAAKNGTPLLQPDAVGARLPGVAGFSKGGWAVRAAGQARLQLRVDARRLNNTLQQLSRFGRNDHAIRVVDTIEMQRELTSGLADLYLSMAGHRMNEVIDHHGYHLHPTYFICLHLRNELRVHARVVTFPGIEEV